MPLRRGDLHMRPSLLAIALGVALIGSLLAWRPSSSETPTAAVIRAPVDPIPCTSSLDCQGGACMDGICKPSCCAADGRCDPCEVCPDPDCP